MSKDFEYIKNDLEFWRKSTRDLKNRSNFEQHDNILDREEDDDDSDVMDISFSPRELRKFRKEESLQNPFKMEDISLEKSHANIDKNTYAKFKNGKMPIDATLDMHGMTLDNAFNQLQNIINRAYSNEQRCILVITGKGILSGGQIRKSFPKWINSSSLRPKVLSFCHACKKDGGSGAFYILIKRKK